MPYRIRTFILLAVLPLLSYWSLTSDKWFWLSGSKFSSITELRHYLSIHADNDEGGLLMHFCVLLLFVVVYCSYRIRLRESLKPQSIDLVVPIFAVVFIILDTIFILLYWCFLTVFGSWQL